MFNQFSFSNSSSTPEIISNSIPSHQVSFAEENLRRVSALLINVLSRRHQLVAEDAIIRLKKSKMLEENLDKETLELDPEYKKLCLRAESVIYATINCTREIESLNSSLDSLSAVAKAVVQLRAISSLNRNISVPSTSSEVTVEKSIKNIVNT